MLERIFWILVFWDRLWRAPFLGVCTVSGRHGMEWGRKQSCQTVEHAYWGILLPHNNKYVCFQHGLVHVDVLELWLWKAACVPRVARELSHRRLGGLTLACLTLKILLDNSLTSFLPWIKIIMHKSYWVLSLDVVLCYQTCVPDMISSNPHDHFLGHALSCLHRVLTVGFFSDWPVPIPYWLLNMLNIITCVGTILVPILQMRKSRLRG